MASKTGSFFKPNQRQKILMDLQKNGELNSQDVPESVRKEAAELRKQNDSCSSIKIREEQFGTGCLSCGKDDDHANLLLCEMCNAEYHTYVMEPVLDYQHQNWVAFVAECNGCYSS